MNQHPTFEAERDAAASVPKKVNIVAPESERVFSLLTPYVNKGKLYRVFSAGETHCQPDYHCHFWNPQHACIMYFESGSGTLSVDDRSFQPMGGDLILMREGHEWEYTTDPDNPWVLHWINLENRLALQILDYYKLPPVSVFTDPDLIFTLKKIQEELMEKDHAFTEKRDRVFQYFLHLTQNFSILLTDRKNNTPAARDAVTVAEYINAHIMQKICVSELASLVFRSSFSVSDIFKKKYGCSIKEYILNAKCEMATRMLRENRTSISEIASALSFCDSQHFSQVFRHRYGMSPSAFRKKCLATEVSE